MSNITIDFKNIIDELNLKEMKLCFLTGKGLFLEDKQKNLYQIPINNITSVYLDRLIKEGCVVEFELVEPSISNNIEEWEREIWDTQKVESFLIRQKLVQIK